MKTNNPYLKIGGLLTPFLWPENRKDLRVRVVVSIICMILAKVASVYTPLILGKSVDSLNDLSNGINLFILMPIALIISYGIARVASLLFGEMRDAFFLRFLSMLLEMSLSQFLSIFIHYLYNFILQDKLVV